MRKFSISLTIIVFLSGSLIAQSDFRPGYIIYNNGDTLTGLIDYKGNQANARKCVFKLSKDAQEEKFTPEDIKAYRFIDSKYYVSKKILTEDSIETQLFLEYLIDGIVDVFYYRDLSDEIYLVDNGDGNLLLVKDKNDVVVVDDVAYANEMKRYRGVLTYVFRKSPKVCKKIDYMQLDHKSIIGIAREYHQEVCTGQNCIVFEKAPQKAKIIVSPLLGTSVDFLRIKNELKVNYYFLEGSDFNVSVFPSAGLTFRVNLPFVDERFGFIFSPELGYREFITRNKGFDSGNPVVFDLRFSQFNLANSVFLSYDFVFDKIRPYVFAGLRINYHFNTDYSRKVLDQSENLLIEYTNNPFPSTYYCPAFGAGISYTFQKVGTFTLDGFYYRDSSSEGVLFEDGLSFRLGYLF
ncbi:MAG TPA: hypothetical protein PK796_09145 [Bacteroidales bacterium]|nr:hypothetical protein [Bacteroidales bacterium]